jgi:hypothetical protein
LQFIWDGNLQLFEEFTKKRKGNSDQTVECRMFFREEGKIKWAFFLASAFYRHLQICILKQMATKFSALENLGNSKSVF